MYSVVPFVSASSLFLSLALLFACRTVLQRKMVVTFHDVPLRKVDTLQCGRKNEEVFCSEGGLGAGLRCGCLEVPDREAAEPGRSTRDFILPKRTRTVKRLQPQPDIRRTHTEAQHT